MLQKALYPLLLSVYFVVFVFSENLGEAFINQIFRSIVILLIVTAAFLQLFKLATRNTDKAAFLTTLLLIFLVATPGLEELVPSRLRSLKTLLLAGEAIGLITVALLVLRRVKNWQYFNKCINVVVLALLALPVYRITSYSLSDNGFLLEPTQKREAVTIDGFKRPEGILPNIYYIIVDAYARADTLQDYFGYDNSEFIDYLENTGFAVAHNGVANYNLTRFAISSVLNLDYLANEKGFIGDTDGQGYPHYLKNQTFNSKVGTVLHQLGYRIVTVRTADTGNYVSIANAENLTVVSNSVSINEFESAMLQTTLLPRIVNKRQVNNFAKQWYDEQERINFIFEEIARESGSAEPLFMVAHMMVPHHPFIYDRNGKVPNISDTDFGKLEHLQADVKAYGDQVYYVNILLRETIDTILANSKTPPIIILQGDHGLRISIKEHNKDDFQSQRKNACLREMLTNLNAIYLPGFDGPPDFYDSISPVNTFRIIFDTYFGSQLGNLDDRSFFTILNQEGLGHTLAEVTGEQNTCNPVWEKRFRALIPKG